MKKLEKPEPPTQSAVDADVARIMAKLGASLETVVPVEDRVYDAFLAYWQKHKKCPLWTEISRQLGVPCATVVSARNRLVDRKPKRIIKYKDTYIPNLT